MKWILSFANTEKSLSLLLDCCGTNTLRWNLGSAAQLLLKAKAYEIMEEKSETQMQIQQSAEQSCCDEAV